MTDTRTLIEGLIENMEMLLEAEAHSGMIAGKPAGEYLAYVIQRLRDLLAALPQAQETQEGAQAKVLEAIAIIHVAQSKDDEHETNRSAQLRILRTALDAVLSILRGITPPCICRHNLPNPLNPKCPQHGEVEQRLITVWTVDRACAADSPFEYDQGDVVLVNYDELYDLVHPRAAAAPPTSDARLTALIEKWTAEADHYQDRAENGRMSDLARGEMIGLAAARRKDAADLEASLRAHEGTDGRQ